VRIALWLCVTVAGPLAGCAAAAKPDPASSLAAQNRAKYEANVGKDYWATLPTSFCAEPNFVNANCQELGAPLHMKIDDLAQGYAKTTFSTIITGDVFYHVTLDDGRRGFISADLASIGGSTVDPVAAAAAAAAECKRRGEPRIGMNAKQLEGTCWGKPDHVNRRQTAKGTRDQYVYSNHRYVDLNNGIVTSIDQGGTKEKRGR